VAVLSGDNQATLAGTPLPVAPVFAPQDQYGNTITNQLAGFTVVAGGGSLASPIANAAPDGSITMPTLNLGRSALPQQVLATVGSKSVVLNASVVSNYSIDLRFWGPAMTAAQQALFTNAAARIRGIVVGAVPPVDATGGDPAACGVSGEPLLSEVIPGLLIYASVRSIDGPGNILAQAGPCFVRDGGDLRTAVGMMEFDVDDLASLTNGGSLQDVITHEMLHVVGVGSFWDADGLLTDINTSTVAYNGTGGITGCRATGGTTICATSVPVENTGGPGTANSHWRESVFGAELMTGFASSGAMPLSIMTVRSLGDIGYAINTAGADPYSIFTPPHLRANSAITPASTFGTAWEKSLPNRPRPLPSSGARIQAAKAR
jgi:hypothetical protein